MTTETITIADSSDDVTSYDDSGTFYFSATVTALGIGGGIPFYAGTRFPSVDIGAGATITTATLTVKSRSGGSGATWGSWYGDDVDDAPAWSSSSRPDQITKTTASTAVLYNSTDATDNAHDVTAIVQEIIDRGGWASGNGIRFGTDPTGADGTALYYDYNDNAAYAAVLSIDYVSVLELTPSLVTNSQTFHAGTVSSVYALTAGLHTNSQTFFAATVTRGAVTLSPSLVTNSQTFHAAAASPTYTLTAGLHTNSQTFYGPTISQTGGTQDLTPSLFTNSNSFYAATVSATYALAPPLTENGQTFYAATVSPGAVTIAPPLVTNAQAFYDPALTATVSLSPSLFTNEQTFYAPIVAASYTLSPALFENGQTFYSAVVSGDGGTQVITPELFANDNAFFDAAVAASSPLVGVPPKNITYGRSIRFDSLGNIIKTDEFDDEPEIAVQPVEIAKPILVKPGKTAALAKRAFEQAQAEIEQARRDKAGADRLAAMGAEFARIEAEYQATLAQEAAWLARLREEDELFLIAA